MDTAPLVFISNLRMPTRKAYGFQIAQFITALVQSGTPIVLRVPYRKNPEGNEPFSYYGLSTPCEFSYVGNVDAFLFEGLLGSKAAFVLSKILFLASHLLYSPPKDARIYTRDPEIAWLFSMRGYRTFFNAHNFPRHASLHVWLLKRVTGIIANSAGTAEEYKTRMRVPVLILPNAVDMHRFDSITKSREELRASLNLPANVPLALYTGHLYAWKGIDTVIEAAALVPEITIVLVGGLVADIARYKEILLMRKITNVLCLGHRAAADIPLYVKAADMALLPNSPTSVESEKYTSPLKLFEYMASRTPIISSDLPSLREILSEQTAYFFIAGNAPSLAECMRAVVTHPLEARERADAAHDLATKKYTWEGNAAKLVEFIA